MSLLLKRNQSLTIMTKLSKKKRLFFSFIGGLSLGLIGLVIVQKKDLPVKEKQPRRHYNRLSEEKSPYLLQHASNPIFWYPWSQDAFEAAKEENKPVFLSIGYSTCYWCHFMEKEVFTSQEIANFLNEHFISIKVDREERPDVDHIYMSALVAFQGSGGWPITMFLTPEGAPFLGHSTLSHDAFFKTIREVHTQWRDKNAEVQQEAQRYTGYLDRILDLSTDAAILQEKVFRKFLNYAFSEFDLNYYGFGLGQKFPQAHIYRLLLRLNRHSEDDEALKLVKSSLAAMAKGGLYDHIGGGFHRYTVDRRWEVPHFEKMLYDNAGLILAYLEYYQVTQDERFLRIAQETLEWVLRDMQDDAGWFYSAIDAGAFKQEGAYYVWSYKELKEQLSPRAFEALQSDFQLYKKGNFENNTIVLNRKSFYKPPHPKTSEALQQLATLRANRTPPDTDTKLITAWNGYMIAALCKAYDVLDDPRYLHAAQSAASFILEHCRTEKNLLFRNYRSGSAFNDGTVDDYAYFIHALIALYQSDFDEGWLQHAIALQETQDSYFWDKDRGSYFFDNGQDPTLIKRPKDIVDSALPAGSSISALNLLHLYSLTYNPQYKDHAERLFFNLSASVMSTPFSFPQLLTAYNYYWDHAKEIAIIGEPEHPDTKAFLSSIKKPFYPNKVLALKKPSQPTTIPLLKDKPALHNSPTLYICESGTCQAPTTNRQVIPHAMQNKQVF